MLNILGSYNQQQAALREEKVTYDALIKAAEAKIERLKKKIGKIEKKRDALPLYSWIKGFVEPLAQELAEQTGLSWEIYGPFGLSASTSIYLREDMSKSITETETFSITLYPDWKDGVLTLTYWTGEITDSYWEGTIGALNGMNLVKLPLSGTIEEIVGLLRKSSASE
jgi:hypothetical protein